MLCIDQCIQREHGLYIKDLRILKNRSLDKTVILDASIFAFMAQLSNGIYIPSYQGSTEDNELLIIKEFLITLRNVQDVKPLVSKFSGLLRASKLFYKERENHVESVEDEQGFDDIGEEYD